MVPTEEAGITLLIVLGFLRQDSYLLNVSKYFYRNRSRKNQVAETVL